MLALWFQKLRNVPAAALVWAAVGLYGLSDGMNGSELFFNFGAFKPHSCQILGMSFDPPSGEGPVFSKSNIPKSPWSALTGALGVVPACVGLPLRIASSSV